MVFYEVGHHLAVHAIQGLVDAEAEVEVDAYQLVGQHVGDVIAARIGLVGGRDVHQVVHVGPLGALLENAVNDGVLYLLGIFRFGEVHEMGDVFGRSFVLAQLLKQRQPLGQRHKLG